MALSVLYIGGTGQISLPCVEASLAAGHDVTILNRNKTAVPLSKGVKTLIGDMNDTAYDALGDEHFDVVAQFRLYRPDQMKRDLATFAGKTGQYVFISSASVYEKPVRHYLMTERTKLENNFWQYSRDKIACEQLLRDQDRLAYTIVRPAHTVRTHMPIQVGDPDAAIRRMIAGKPVIVAGDGSSLWTLTRSSRRIADSPGTRSTRRSLVDSASRRSTRTFRRKRSSVSIRSGRASYLAIRRGRRFTTTPR
jgi:nucleoside-diphosphate-sugar epimerase